jgi:hypothetical protein
MPIRRWARSFEKRTLRPLAGLIRQTCGSAGRRPNRIARLEQRIDELEALVRELTGLAWLQLDDPAEHLRPPATVPGDREAA